MKNFKKTRLNAANILTFGLICLFVVFLLSTISALTTTNLDPNNITQVQQSLYSLKISQWVFLLIGSALTIIAIFWGIIQRHKEQNTYDLLLATLEAIYKSQAIIEFNPDGTIITANDKFLDVVGYSLGELQGRHHSLLVSDDYKSSSEYKQFWEKLRRGEYDQAEYKRIKKGGDEVWLQSAYNPILDKNGKTIRIIKVATDITGRKKQEAKLATLAQSFKEVGQQILIDSNDLAIGITELEKTAVSQAASAAEQSTSITEISTTIEEIKVTTQQTHEKAKQLGESAEITNKEAENGKTAISKMSESMQVLQDKIGEISSTILGLNEKTQQIGEITETVADIAKQSKLLALNAAIEAAKAGESGKGFAVVAGEVKDLAEKSQLSTERVQKILQDIRQTSEKAVLVTESGTKSVDENIHQVIENGKTINTLADVIEKSALASLQIVSAVREESVALEQIDLSMKEISKVTSMFASASEETKQAIIGLSKVAESLKSTAAIYKE